MRWEDTAGRGGAASAGVGTPIEEDFLAPIVCLFTVLLRSKQSGRRVVEWRGGRAVCFHFFLSEKTLYN
jgi:hypothetical protein